MGKIGKGQAPEVDEYGRWMGEEGPVKRDLRSLSGPVCGERGVKRK